MLTKKDIEKLIREYAKIMKIDYAFVYRVFWRGDIFQRKRDLIAMRGTLYAKKHIKKGTPYNKQQKIMEKFSKTQNLKDAKFPKIKIHETN